LNPLPPRWICTYLEGRHDPQLNKVLQLVSFYYWQRPKPEAEQILADNWQIAIIMGKSQRCPKSCALAVLGVTAAAILAIVVYLGVTKLGDSTSSVNANAGHQVRLSSFGASASTIN